MSTELGITVKSLEGAASYLDVFGSCEGGENQQSSHVKRVYHKLAKVVHPDLYSTDDEKKLAEQSFQKLLDFKAAANRAILEGNYGKLPTTTFRTKTHTYEVGELLRRGEVADLYGAVAGTGSSAKSSVLKLARSPRDNDLLEAETRALKRLLARDGEEDFFAFFPILFESITYRDECGRNRRGNFLERLDGWYSLDEVQAAYPSGVSPLDMVWIWRRLLWSLGYVHERGLIHGAILPSHIMIQPELHGLKLVDWCYSSLNLFGEDRFAPIKAISSMHKSLYPPEVTSKENPSFGTDIFLAVRSMVYLLGGDATTGQLSKAVPKGIRAFFSGCCQANQKRRPQEAWQLLVEFDELLEQLGGPYWPRRFRKFQMPA